MKCKRCGSSIVIDGTGIHLGTLDPSRPVRPKNEPAPASLQQTGNFSPRWRVVQPSGAQHELSLAELAIKHEQGEFEPGTLVCQPGRDEWLPPQDFPDILARAYPGGSAQVRASQPTFSDETVALGQVESAALTRQSVSSLASLAGEATVVGNSPSLLAQGGRPAMASTGPAKSHFVPAPSLPYRPPSARGQTPGLSKPPPTVPPPSLASVMSGGAIPVQQRKSWGPPRASVSSRPSPPRASSYPPPSSLSSPPKNAILLPEADDDAATEIFDSGIHQQHMPAMPPPSQGKQPEGSAISGTQNSRSIPPPVPQIPPPFAPPTLVPPTAVLPAPLVSHPAATAPEAGTKHPALVDAPFPHPYSRSSSSGAPPSSSRSRFILEPPLTASRQAAWGGAPQGFAAPHSNASGTGSRLASTASQRHVTLNTSRVQAHSHPPPKRMSFLYSSFLVVVLLLGAVGGAYVFQPHLVRETADRIRIALRLTTEEEVRAAAGPPFDTQAAGDVLGKAALEASQCHQPTGPDGKGRAQILYEPSGVAVSVAVSRPFHETTVGNCLLALFKSTRVPAFAGDPVIVTKTFDVR